MAPVPSNGQITVPLAAFTTPIVIAAMSVVTTLILAYRHVKLRRALKGTKNVLRLRKEEQIQELDQISAGVREIAPGHTSTQPQPFTLRRDSYSSSESSARRMRACVDSPVWQPHPDTLFHPRILLEAFENEELVQAPMELRGFSHMPARGQWTEEDTRDAQSTWMAAVPALQILERGSNNEVPARAPAPSRRLRRQSPFPVAVRRDWRSVDRRLDQSIENRLLSPERAGRRPGDRPLTPPAGHGEQRDDLSPVKLLKEMRNVRVGEVAAKRPSVITPTEALNVRHSTGDVAQVQSDVPAEAVVHGSPVPEPSDGDIQLRPEETSLVAILCGSSPEPSPRSDNYQLKPDVYGQTVASKAPTTPEPQPDPFKSKDRRQPPQPTTPRAPQQAPPSAADPALHRSYILTSPSISLISRVTTSPGGFYPVDFPSPTVDNSMPSMPGYPNTPSPPGPEEPELFFT